MKNLYIILLLTFGFGQDYSLSFDGEDDWVEAGAIDLTSSPFTIESWFWVNRAPGSGADMNIITRINYIY